MKTPFTRSGLTQYDGIQDTEAIFLAWMRPGADPAWHDRCREEVRDRMPLLARALDRFCERLRIQHADEDFMGRVDRLDRSAKVEPYRRQEDPIEGEVS